MKDWVQVREGRIDGTHQEVETEKMESGKEEEEEEGKLGRINKTII